MHILHVFATFSPGGPQVRAAELINRLGRDARHTVVAMDRQTQTRERIEGVECELVDPPPPGGFLRTARTMARMIRERSPDLVLTYNWGAIETVLGARLAKMRALLHHEEGFGPQETDRFLRRRIWIRRALFPSTHAVIVPSHVLERVATDVWKQPETRVRYLPNGVDLERFRPREAAAKREAGEEVVIGNVAHFRGEKNQALLIRAFAQCKHRERARLLLVGDGPTRADAERLANELGVADRVRFAGPTPDTAPHYAEMDVFALSSRTEQMPLVVLEAMASGLPIASTDVGDVRTMVAECQRDAIVPRDDAKALAAALDQWIDAPDRRRITGADNRRRCEERFETGKCLQAHIDLYEDARRAAGGRS